MKLAPLALLVIFLVFRHSFSSIRGRRDRNKVSSSLLLMRRTTESLLGVIIPALLILEVIPTRFYAPAYYLGIACSVLGLSFMIWTRLHRDKDWGFMGDDPGESFFTEGPHRFTRHPYYVGCILFGTGLYLQLNPYMALVMLLSILSISYAIRQEEIFLKEKFDSKYTEYKNKVGIFPWLY